jgi:hypothetical protein
MCICHECKQIHQRTPATKHHKIEQGFINELCYCSDHKRNKLESYCETCEEMICKECLEDHKEHNIQPTNKTLDDNHDKINKFIRSFNPNLALSEKQAQCIDNEIQNLRVLYTRWREYSNRRWEILLTRLKDTKALIDEHVDQEELKISTD